MPVLQFAAWFDRVSMQYLQTLEDARYESDNDHRPSIRCLIPLCLAAATPSHCPSRQMTTAEFTPFHNFLLHHRCCRHLHVTSTTPIFSIQCPMTKKEPTKVEYTIQLGMCPYETSFCINTDYDFKRITWPHKGEESFCIVGGSALVMTTKTGYHLGLSDHQHPSQPSYGLRDD